MSQEVSPTLLKIQQERQKKDDGSKGREINRYQRVRLKWRDRYFFTEQMALLLDAGVAIVPALELLERSAKGRLLALFLKRLRENVVKGYSISETLKVFPRSFTVLYIAMVQIGEESGQLPATFSYLSTMEASRQESYQSVRKAIVYPVMVLVVAMIVVVFIMVAVVPTFESLYHSSRVDLPVLTQKVMAVSASLSSRQGGYAIFSVLLLAVFFRGLYRKSLSVRRYWDGLILKIPLFGDMLRNDFNARTCDVLAMMLRSGVPLVNSLSLYEVSVVNSYLRNKIETMKWQLMQGESFYKAALDAGIFTDTALTLISVGEMSGKLDSVLVKSGSYHKTLVENRVELLISLIDPLSLVFIGGVVGVILIALYLPMFSIGMTL